MTNPEKILQTWTTLKQLIISAKDNCKQKLAECKEHGRALGIKLEEHWNESAKNNEQHNKQIAKLEMENKRLKEQLASLNKDWTEIHEYFDTEQKVKWINAGFTYSQTKSLVEKGFRDLTFLTWVKNTKKLEPHTLTKEQLTQLAQEWKNNNSSARRHRRNYA